MDDLLVNAYIDLVDYFGCAMRQLNCLDAAVHAF